MSICRPPQAGISYVSEKLFHLRSFCVIMSTM